MNSSQSSPLAFSLWNKSAFLTSVHSQNNHPPLEHPSRCFSLMTNSFSYSKIHFTTSFRSQIPLLCLKPWRPASIFCTLLLPHEWHISFSTSNSNVFIYSVYVLPYQNGVSVSRDGAQFIHHSHTLSLLSTSEITIQKLRLQYGPLSAWQ